MHRRRLLVGLVAMVATACGLGRERTLEQPGSEAAPSPAGRSPAPTPPAPRPDPSVDWDTAEEPAEPAEPGHELPPAPAPAAPYEPVAAETHPNAKALGAAVAQALTTYEPDEPLEEVVARAAAGGHGGDDVEAARPLHHPDGWSRGEVLYPQFGGLTTDRCSIMAVVRQTRGRPDGTTIEVVRTVDVRLRLSGGDWVFDALASAGGEPVDRPAELPEVAVAVLDDPRIELPDSARWDIHRGATSLALLGLMQRLADETGGYAVCVLESGHPINVFGTDRLSDHTRGRAVDIHRIADRLVIEDRGEGSATDRAVGWLYDDAARPIVGSPWALDAYGGRSFTDAVHQDHLHVAVPRAADEGDPPDEEATP
jgi:hypothetical protein